MKKRVTLLFVMFAALVTTAMADNVVSASPLTIGKDGTADLTINLKNDAEMKGVQFSLILPEGIEIVEDKTSGVTYKNDEGQDVTYIPNGGLKVSTTERTDGWTVLGNYNETGKTYNFVLLSLSGGKLAVDTEGSAIMKIKFATSLAVGTYEVSISNIHLASISGEGIVDLSSENNEVTTESVTVDVRKKGDVNGDNNVTVTDAVCIINYLYDPTSNEVFYETMADVNSDSNITVSDAVSIINILYESTASSRGIEVDDEEEMQDPD